MEHGPPVWNRHDERPLRDSEYCRQRPVLPGAHRGL